MLYAQKKTSRSVSISVSKSQSNTVILLTSPPHEEASARVTQEIANSRALKWPRGIKVMGWRETESGRGLRIMNLQRGGDALLSFIFNGTPTGLSSSSSSSPAPSPERRALCLVCLHRDGHTMTYRLSRSQRNHFPWLHCYQEKLFWTGIKKSTVKTLSHPAETRGECEDRSSVTIKQGGRGYWIELFFNRSPSLS